MARLLENSLVEKSLLTRSPSPEEWRGAVEGSQGSALTAPRVPITWLLTGDRIGDNRQAEAVARALPWPVQRRYVRVREPFATAKPKVEASVHHLDLAASDPLHAPWPDLIVTMGRRLSMVALWIREQALRARGERARIVLVGKPSGLDHEFDLVVVSSETPLSPRPNVVSLDLPLLRVDPAAVAAEARKWQDELGVRAKPRIALLVGGPTYPFRFDAAVATQMIDRVAAYVDEANGSLAVTTSPRTPAAFHTLLRERLDDRAWIHRFEPGATENPYLGLLGTADAFVVTGDSLSMLVEIARLGKPLAIYPLPHGASRASRWLSRVATRLLTSTAAPDRGHVLAPLGHALYRAGLIRQSRNFDAIYGFLVRHRLATWWGDGFSPGGVEAPDELSTVVHRVERLMEA